jgi:hypothetical protein
MRFCGRVRDASPGPIIRVQQSTSDSRKDRYLEAVVGVPNDGTRIGDCDLTESAGSTQCAASRIIPSERSHHVIPSERSDHVIPSERSESRDLHPGREVRIPRLRSLGMTVDAHQSRSDPRSVVCLLESAE